MIKGRLNKKSKQRFDVHRTLPDRHFQSARPSDSLPSKESKPSMLRWKKTLLAITALILAFAIFVAGWDAVNISRASSQLFGPGNLASLIFSKHLKGSERGRVNILLVGYSKDDPGHSGGKLTDSILVLSLSTKKHTGYMLSIPRDLYVNLPHFGHAKINEAYQDGGITMLRQVITKNFGLPIDHYVIINYTAVREIVNALGGIDIKVKSQDKRGLYDPNINKHDGGPLRLTNGWHHLDGQTALNYSRARGDPSSDGRLSYGFAGSDFDRTQHQRQVLAAIQNKIGWLLVLNPLKNGKLFQALAKNIKTNIKTDEARPLFGLFHGVKDSDLKSVGLNKLNGQDLLSSYAAPGGSSALAPAAGLDNYSQIQAALAKLK